VIELKKLWLEGGYSKLIDQKKKGKLLLSSDPNEINWDNLNNE
jgi:hypothetical protein